MGFKVSATTAAGEKVPPTPPLQMICFRNKQDVDRVVSGSLREHFGMENGEASGIPQAPVGKRGGLCAHTLAPFPVRCPVFTCNSGSHVPRFWSQWKFASNPGSATY